MNVIINNAEGQRMEGVLLAAGRYGLRVMFPGQGDVTELNYEYGQWTLGTSKTVELEAVLTDSVVDCASFNSEVLTLQASN